MSAFLLPSDHIDLVVTAAFAAQLRDGRGCRVVRARRDDGTELAFDDGQGNELGHLLLHENARSVLTRYPDPDVLDADEVERYACTLDSYRFRPVVQFDPTATHWWLTALQASHSLGYQSCETSDWQQSDAYTLLQVIDYQLQVQAIKAAGVASDGWCWCR